MKTKPEKNTESPDQNKKSFLNDKLVPMMEKIGNQRHLAAIRDSFQSLLPLILAGAVGVLLTTIVFGGLGSENVSLLGMVFTIFNWDEAKSIRESGGYLSDSISWQSGPWDEISNVGVGIFAPLNKIALGLMSIYIAFLVGYFLSTSRDGQTHVIAGFISLATFLLFINFQPFFLDAKGLITAIIAGIVGGETFIAFAKMEKLQIKMPSSVPVTVGKAFGVFVPALITLSIWSLFNYIVLQFSINHQYTISNSLIETISFYDYGIGTDGSAKPLLAELDFSTDELDLIIYQYENNPSTENQLLYESSLLAKELIDKWSIKYEEMSLIIQTSTSEEATQIIVNIFDDLKLIAINGGYSDEVISLATNQVMVNNVENEIAISQIGENWGTTMIDYKGGSEAPSAIVVLTYQTLQVDSSEFAFSGIVYLLIQVPFMNVMNNGGGYFIVMIYVFLVSFFWFFGINGANITSGIFDAIWYGTLAANASIFASFGNPELAMDYMDVYSKSFFDSFIQIGGGGSTLVLIITVLFFSKRNDLRKLSKISLPAGIFRITEPMIYGVPLVLNFRFVVPLIVGPMVSITIASIAVSTGFMYPSYVLFPWPVPFMLGGMLSNGFQMPLHTILVSLTCWITVFMIWFPFVLIDNSIEENKRMKLGQGSETEVIFWDYRAKTKSEITVAKENQDKLNIKKLKSELKEMQKINDLCNMANLVLHDLEELIMVHDSIPSNISNQSGKTKEIDETKIEIIANKNSDNSIKK